MFLALWVKKKSAGEIFKYFSHYSHFSLGDNLDGMSEYFWEKYHQLSSAELAQTMVIFFQVLY